MNAIENWLLNVFLGKLVTRAAVTVVAAVAAPKVQAVLQAAGVQVSIDPVKLAAESIILGQAALEAYKHWRVGTPAGNVAAAQAIEAKAP